MTTSEYQKQWRIKNADKIKEYREKNSDKLKAYAKERRNNPEFFVKYMHEGIIARTRKKGFDESKVVTIKQLQNLLVKSNGKCAKTGLPLTVKRKSYFIASPDRIDSSKGYVKGNIQIVCMFYNLLKKDNTDEHAMERFNELKTQIKNLDI